MAAMAQLTLDGREVAPAQVRNRRPLTPGQRALLQALATHDLTDREAGRTLHLSRDPRCAYCLEGRCGFVTADGSDAMRRLCDRGLCEQTNEGWTCVGVRAHEGK